MVIYNLHANDFVFCPVSYFIVRRKPHLKYSYLSAWDEGDNVYTFDLSESSFVSKKTLNRFSLMLGWVVFIEVILWAFLNRIPFRKIVFQSRLTGKKNKSLLIFSYKSCVDGNEQSLRHLSSYRKVYIHLSHYMIRVGEKREFIDRIDTEVCLLGDSDYRENSFYQFYFSQYGFEILPFRPAERFKSNTTNIGRNGRLFASGTIHNLREEKPLSFYREFCDFFKTDTYHTLRKSLMNTNLPFLDKDYGLWEKQRESLSGGNYFDRDLVKTFNNYSYVCYGSELSGAPSLSNIEAMFCGSIAFLDKRYITGLPFEEGIDFVNINEHACDISSEINKALINIVDGSNLAVDESSLRNRYDLFLINQLRKLCK